MSAFTAVGLSHTYPGAAVKALDRLTLTVPAGQVTAVLGPSGCGKSTLLALLGLLWDGPGPTGRLTYHGADRDHDLLALDTNSRAALRGDAFGFVLQSNYLLPHFTCLQNVAMPLALQGWPARVREAWARRLLAAPGVDPHGDLAARADAMPRAVSLGQRQRFAVLRALAADPDVVFADEPSSNLDPRNTTAMFELLALWRGGDLFPAAAADFAADRATPAKLRPWLAAHAGPRRPRTLVLVCHDAELAERHADAPSVCLSTPGGGA